LHQPSLVSRASAGKPADLFVSDGWHLSAIASATVEASFFNELLNSNFFIQVYMYYVYLIRSIKFPMQTYVGLTNNLKKRLADHNAGKAFHSIKYKPWELVMYLGFKEKTKAAEFEQYLKSGSGRSFANKRFW